ncbi:hypothetical protein [Chromobacterium sinusclupearum]|uniref:hypothetical protein n=1 Tax=Chromobacterium sinusclupearum TaxID=2077146 RepID=UPI000CD13385|nr:hypothetical protein [Chromobacterium sinusclupearum]
MSQFCSTVLAGFMLAASLPGHSAGRLLRVDGDHAAPITLSGTVIGPIAAGSKAEGTFSETYHLKLRQPIRLDDAGACGARRVSSLALSQEDMARLKGHAVTVQARVFCQESRAVAYRLADITVL